MRARLAVAGYAVMPVAPNPEGTIVEQDEHPKVGIWLMPDNTMPGMLEHFISFLGADQDPLWAIADGCLDEIPANLMHFAPNHRVKAHIHTWLAWQEEPGTPFGSAITKPYLNADAPHAERLIAWVRRLFDL